MKIFVKIFLCLIVICFTMVTPVMRRNTNVALAKYDSVAQSMVVIEAKSGRVLNEKNAKTRRPMASTTKIATAITVIENEKNIQREIVVPNEAQGVEGSSIYLQAGERIKIIDLLYGLMLQSGNDCAVALALSVCDSIEEFSLLMNETVKKAGAENTNFVNPHGLHDDNHYTTAIDLAKITAYALKNKIFANIVSTKKYTCRWDGKEYDRVLINKNKILSTYEGGNGVKTGYTKKAGRCLVASAKKNGMEIIAVVLNCGPMFEDCKNLMDDAFENYKMVNFSEYFCGKIMANVFKGKEKQVALSVSKGRTYPLNKKEINALTYETENIIEMTAPIEIGKENGKIKIFVENELLFVEKLFTIKDVDALTMNDTLGGLVEKWHS